jgi:signal transduction histidine kinase
MGERTEIAIDVVVEGAIPRLGSDAETALFRVVQESLTNVAKHAAAGQVAVRIEAADDELRLSVRDDGRGFDPDALPDRPSGGPSGLGLAGIKERIQLLGGTVEISSTPGLGTCLNATVPIALPEPMERAA